MRLFIDSSDVTLWDRYKRQGWLYGATTNPLILRRDGRSCNLETYRELVAAADETGLEELQIQATGKDETDLLSSARAIAALSEIWDHVVVKIPLTRAGLSVGAQMMAERAHVTMTAAYASQQMIAATAMGNSSWSADYIAPYYGRLIESGADADEIVSRMIAISKGNERSPRVLVASIRSLEQLEHLAAMGANIFTLAPNIAEQLGQSELSDRAAADFESAAQSG